jgi:hypothetical protein
MGKILLFSITFLLTCIFQVSHAGTGAIPSGSDIKLLKNNLRFKTGNVRIMAKDADDPTVVAKNGEEGSIYIQDGTGYLFWKQDVGISANWLQILLSASGTDECIARFDGTGAPLLQDSVVCIDDLGVITGVTQLNVDNLRLDGNTISSTNLNGDVILDPDGTGKVVVNSDLDILGTVTQIAQSSLAVTNSTIIVNDGGNQATADANDAGLIVEMSDATDAQIGYDSTTASKFIAGEVGDLREVTTVSHTQTLTNKTIDADLNTITNIEDADIKAGANIARSKIASGTANHVIINDGTGALSSEAQLAASRGGTGGDSSAATGVAQVNAGVWSYSDVDLTTSVTGVLPIANGGTNSSTALNNDRLMVSSGDAIVESGALTDGQVVIGSTGAAPVISTISGTLNQVNVTNGAGSITLSTPQDIHSGASPTFAGATITGLTANRAVVTDGSSALASSAVTDTELGLLSGRTYIPDAVGVDNQVAVFNGTNSLDSSANLTFDGTILSLTGNQDVTGDLDVDQVNIDGNTVSTVAATDLTLAPGTTGDLDLVLSGNTYTINQRSPELYIQSPGSNNMQLELFCETPPCSNGFRAVGSGTPAGVAANSQFLDLRYDVAGTEYLLSTNQIGAGILRPLEMRTGTNNNQLFLATDGAVGVGTGSPTSKLDVSGSIEQSGNEIFGKSLLVNGSFEDGSPGPFTSTVGTLTTETTNVLFGSSALDVNSGTTIDIEACVTNAQWEGRQAEVGCYVKSTLNDISLCFNDGTNDDTCNTSYDGSNVWKYVFQRGTPQSGEEMCIHITGSTAGTIELDNCVIKEPEFSTAEIANETEEITFNADSSTMTDRSALTDLRWGTVNESGENLIEYDDSNGRFTALKKLKLNLVWQGLSGTTVAFDIRKNGTVIMRCSNAANFETPCPANVDMEPGDYITMQSAIVLTSNAAITMVATATTSNVIVATENDQPFKAENNSSITISSASETRVVYAVDDGSVNDSFDPGNNYDTSTGLFTAPRSGDYKLKASCVLGNATSEGYRIRLRRVADSKLLGLTVLQTSNSNTLIVTNIAKLNKGDQVEVTMDSDSDTSYVCQQDGTNFEGHAIDSKALLAGLEDISVSPALYFDGTGDSIPNGVYTKIGYDTVVEDKDQLVVDPTTNWRYIVPNTGVYEVTAGALLLNATVSNGDTMGLRLNINSGTSFKDIALIRHQGAFTSNYLLNGTVKVSLSEGDELIVEAFQNSDPSLTVNASDTQSYISITKEEATLSAGADIYQNTLVKAADNGFTSGSIRINRTANQVCLTTEATLLHASVTSVATSTGWLPTWARPNQVVTNLYDFDASKIKRLTVNTNGEFLLSFKDYAGADTTDPGSASANVCYAVP